MHREKNQEVGIWSNEYIFQTDVSLKINMLEITYLKYLQFQII